MSYEEAELQDMAQALGHSMDGDTGQASNGTGDESSGEQEVGGRQGVQEGCKEAGAQGVQLILHRQSSRASIDLAAIDWQRLRYAVEQAARDDVESGATPGQESLDDALEQLRSILQGPAKPH
jgi:hypothetical protein